MGTYDTRGGSPLHDKSFDRGEVSDLEELVLGNVEEYDEISAAKRDAKGALQRSLHDVMSALLPPGEIIERGDRKRPWLAHISTIRGSDYNARKFEVVSLHSVTIDDAHVENSKWSAIVFAISDNGKRMNGRTFRDDGTIWVSGPICREPSWDLQGDAYKQAWRDSLCKVVAEADRIRGQAELDAALKGD